MVTCDSFCGGGSHNNICKAATHPRRPLPQVRVTATPVRIPTPSPRGQDLQRSSCMWTWTLYSGNELITLNGEYFP